MAADLSGKYFVKKKLTDEWVDFTAMFVGANVLAITGFNERGNAVNVYNEQWVNSISGKEDFLVTTQDAFDNDVIIRENVDLDFTFICGERYGAIDTQAVYDAIVDYMCNHGDFYIKSTYTDKQAHVVCLKSFKPTTQKLKRGVKSFILATVNLHTLEPPVRVSI